MENLVNIIDILIENIERSSSKMTMDLKNNIKALSSPGFQPLRTITHKQSHKNVFFTLANCNETHCIECMSEFVTCDHGKSLTKYEISLFKLLSRKLSLPQLNIETIKFCLSCKLSDTPLCFNYKPCFCECFSCIHKNIVIGKYTCSICSSQYNIPELEKLYARNNQKFPGLIKICQACRLPIFLEGFNSDICLICNKIRKFL